MEAIEYQITFIAFFIGLGIADLFSSLIRLLKRRDVIEWHPLPLVWAVVAFLGLIVAWFAYYGIAENPESASGAGFMLAISPAIFIFAFTVSILPHEIPAEGLSLHAYYLKQRKLIFILFTLDMLARIITWRMFMPVVDPTSTITFLIILIILNLLILGLVFTKKLWYHWLVAFIMLLFYFLNVLSQSLV